jgi:hypothetical protein
MERPEAVEAFPGRRGTAGRDRPPIVLEAGARPQQRIDARVPQQRGGSREQGMDPDGDAEHRRGRDAVVAGERAFGEVRGDERPGGEHARHAGGHRPQARAGGQDRSQ